MTTPDPKKAPDWAHIEAEYRAGIKSSRQIAETQGVSHVAVNKRAKKEGWTRNLAAKIQAAADEMVTKAAVTSEVTKAKKLTEQTVIQAAATAVYQVRIEHRTDIRRSRALFQSLLGELEMASTPEGQDLMDQLLQAMAEESAGDDPEQANKRLGRMREALSKVLSMPGRIDAAKKAVEMLEKVVRMEREAFGMTVEDGKPPPTPSVIVIPPKDAE